MSVLKVGAVLRLVRTALKDEYDIDAWYECPTVKGTTNQRKITFFLGKVKKEDALPLGTIIVNSRNLTEDKVSELAMKWLNYIHFNACNVYDLTAEQIFFLSKTAPTLEEATTHSEPMNDDYLALAELGLIDIEDADRHGVQWKTFLTPAGMDAIEFLSKVTL